MRIGLIASPWVPVPPPLYGGTEGVIDILARGLVRAGHDVQLVATGDSTCPVPRHAVYATALGTNGVSLAAEARQVVRAYSLLEGCDVIHDHTLIGPLYAGASRRVPVVTTNHGPFTEELTEVYAAAARHAAVVAISHHQRSCAPTVPVAAVIHHGIDVETFPVGRGDGGYALFLGRMSPDKGIDRAIRAARGAGLRLLIAAKMWEPAEHCYFHDVVEPLLGFDAVYLGEVGGAAKMRLLGDAVALVNPIRWPEPFGLVMIEALACGTPVVAFPEGAAPEIVDDGVTGFLCDNEAEMSEALSRVAAIDRGACREAAATRFCADRMVADHLRLYERLRRWTRRGIVERGPRTVPHVELSVVEPHAQRGEGHEAITR